MISHLDLKHNLTVVHSSHRSSGFVRMRSRDISNVFFLGFFFWSQMASFERQVSSIKMLRLLLLHQSIDYLCSLLR